MREIDKIIFNLQNLTFTTTPNRINEMKWSGAVTKIGVPSDGIPGGAWSKTLFEKTAVEAALNTLKSMPLNCSWPEDWYSNPAYALIEHDSRFCIGVVEKAWIDGDYLMCSGIIWKDNFPDVSFMIQNAQSSLGFSIEAYPKEYEEEKQKDESVIMRITEIEFCGVCICWQNVAAYSDTFITMLAATKKNINRNEECVMTPEQVQEMLDAMVLKLEASNKELVNGLNTRIAELEASNGELNAKLEAVNAEKVAKEAEFEVEKAELNAKLEAAAQVIPGPTVGVQTPAVKDKLNATEELAKINKMTCSPEEKAQLRFAVWAKASN